MKDKETVVLFKSLADSTRLQILQLLAQKKEMSCQELSDFFHLSQPTLSHHFKKLVDAHILKARKSGIWMYYSINQHFLREKGINLKKLLAV